MALLFDMQGASLHTLELNQQAINWTEPGPAQDGLCKLRLASLCSGIPNHWEPRMIANNCKTLRQLEVGFETDALYDFYEEVIWHTDIQSNREAIVRFGRTLKVECQRLGASMSLDSLKLINSNVNVVLDDTHWPFLDLRNLTRLVLEDDHGLWKLFLCFRLSIPIHKTLGAY